MSAFASVLVMALAFAQVPEEPSIQKLFEAGHYGPLLDRVAASEAPAPEGIYLAGQALRPLHSPRHGHASR